MPLRHFEQLIMFRIQGEGWKEARFMGFIFLRYPIVRACVLLSYLWVMTPTIAFSHKLNREEGDNIRDNSRTFDRRFDDCNLQHVEI